MPLEGAETSIDFPKKADPEAEKKQKGIELLLSQVDRLSQLIQQEIETEEPNSPEDEAEFQGYMQEWVAEYQYLAQAGSEHQKEALEALGMIRLLLGDLPIDEKLLPKDIYDLLLAEG